MAKKMKIGHNLPEKVFVYWDGKDDDSYLLACETEDEAVDRDEKYIGVYELKEIHLSKLVTTTKTVTKVVK